MPEQGGVLRFMTPDESGLHKKQKESKKGGGLNSIILRVLFDS
jgi:hypothetical protein